MKVLSALQTPRPQSGRGRTFFYGDFVEILKRLLTSLLPYPIIIIKMEKVDFSMEIL